MISQRCPKCGSRHIRRGYKPTPVLLRMFGIYNLLCNHCNLLFRGFAVPGTVSKPGSNKKKRSSNEKQDTKDTT